MEQKLVLMENRLDKSERENKELKTRLRNMEIQMNEIAQKQYNNQMEISGVKDKNINAEIAVSKVLEKTGYKAGEVQHRVEKVVKIGEGRQEKTSIVVHFRTQDDRNSVLDKIKKDKVFTKLGNTIN
ncbi:hypothetical protein M8J75_004232 [Diaphorina citri]|nr:hypothetical protein M8J75_004232 [Diaphorina citri]